MLNKRFIESILLSPLEVDANLLEITKDIENGLPKGKLINPFATLADDENSGQGGDKGGKRWFITDQQVDIKQLAYYRFLGKFRGPTVQLQFTLKRDERKKIKVPRLEDGSNLFLLVIKQEVPVDAIPSLRNKLSISGDKYTLNINRRDFFAVVPDDKDLMAVRVYTPYTGRYFSIRLRDDVTMRFQQFDNTVVDRSFSDLNKLLHPKASRPLSRIYYNSQFLNRAISGFDTVQDRIIEEIKDYLKEKELKKSRFTYRVGDVVTGFKGTEKNWLVAKRIYNKHTNEYIYLMVDADDDRNFELSPRDIEDKTILQKASAAYNNPLEQLPGIKYVRTVDQATIQKVGSALYDTAVKIANTLGLDSNSIIVDKLRDKDIELPPREEREDKPDETALVPERIIYLNRLPDQNININVSATPKKLQELTDEIIKKYKKLQEEDTSKIDQLEAEKNKEINNLKARYSRGELTESEVITFPDGEGWYLIVDKKQRTGSSDIEWTLMPYPKGRIKALVPVQKKRDLNSPINNSRSPYLQQQKREDVRIEKEAVDYDYYTFVLPPSGEKSLEHMVTYFANQSGIKTIRIPKDKRIIKDMRRHVQERDISGNTKRIEAGDLIVYDGKRYYVANRKEKGKKLSYLLAPIAAFTDIEKNMERPFKFFKGGVPAFGYLVATFSKEGSGSLDQQAIKLATKENLKDSGIRELFIDFYANYNADGTPLERPRMVKPDEVFQEKRKFQIERDIGIDESLMGDANFRDKFRKDRNRGDNINRNDNVEDPDSYDGQTEEEREDKINKDENRISLMIKRNELIQGMLIEYDWGNIISTEIFYGQVDKDRIRLVPHNDFKLGPESNGVVPASGFVDVVRNDNIKSAGFWSNYIDEFYTDSSRSSSTFTFSMDFEDIFTSYLQRDGEKVPSLDEMRSKTVDEIEKDQALRNVRSRRNKPPAVIENYVKGFADKLFGNAVTDSGGTRKEYRNENAIGTVIRYVRDGEVLKGVVDSDKIQSDTDVELKELWELSIHTDSNTNRAQAKVKLIDIDRIVNPRDIDPNYNENREYHNQMKHEFASYIKESQSFPNANLSQEVIEYYKNMFDIELVK